MNNRNQDKPGWQTALEHHEALCAERGRTIDARFNSVDIRFDAIDQRFEAVDQRFEAVNQRFDSLEKRLDSIEKLQRLTIGAILGWPLLLIALMKLIP